jgi:ribosomal protein S18 acetylase RimI-like enzyme
VKQVWLIIRLFVVVANMHMFASMDVPTIIEVRRYNQLRDSADLIKLCKQDRYWLFENKRFDIKRFCTEASRCHMFVIHRDGHCIGCVAYGTLSAHTGKLYLLVVDKKYRSQGYGSLLIHHALTHMKDLGMHEVSVVTRIENTVAIDMYTRLFDFQEQRRTQRLVYFKKEIRV